MENSIRLKIGENELEISGSEKFIEKQLNAFVSRLGISSSATAPAIKLVDSKSDHVPTTRKSGKHPSPAEYVREKRPKGGTEQLIVLGKYLEEFGGVQEFSMREIKEVSGQAKIKNIHSNYFSYAVKQGLMRNSGRGKYSLTLSGEDAVLAMPKVQGK